MALGTVTKPTPNPDYVAGNKRVRVRDVQITSGANYTTGGVPLPASAFGLRVLQQVIFHGQARATAGGGSGFTLAYDYVNGTMQAYFSQSTTVDAEAPNNTNLSPYSVRITAIGY